MLCGLQWPQGKWQLSRVSPHSDIRSRVFCLIMDQKNLKWHSLIGPRYRVWVHMAWISVIDKSHSFAQLAGHTLTSGLHRE